MAGSPWCRCCGGKKADPICEQLVDKMAAVMAEDEVAKSDDAKERALGVAECRKHLDETKAAPQTRCILAAASTDDVRACMAGFLKTVEGAAKFELHRIARAARRSFEGQHRFPAGTARPLPAAPPGELADIGACCNGPGFKCAVTTEWSADPAWKALGFSIDEPSYYQYSYESDGTSFEATAIGDRDCDGARATYTLVGKVDGGHVTIKLDEPPRNAY